MNYEERSTAIEHTKLLKNTYINLILPQEKVLKIGRIAIKRCINIKAQDIQGITMQIKDRKIANAYSESSTCPYCKTSKSRISIECEVATIEKDQVIDSTYTIENLCAHCFTVCGQFPKQDFLCARCEQLTPYAEEDVSLEWRQFLHLFSEGDDCKFEKFYKELMLLGVEKGKRYCLPCVYKLWQEYLANPSSLREEIEKPRKEYPLKASGK